MLHDTLLSRDSFAAANLDPITVQRLLREHESTQADHSQRLYALLMLELWCRRFLDGSPA